MDDGESGIIPNPQVAALPRSEFERYAKQQEKICAAYRDHMKDLIEQIRDEIKNTIYITTALIGILITVLRLLGV